MLNRKRTQKDVTDPRILEIWEEVKAEALHLFPEYFEYCTPELYQDNSTSRMGCCSQSYRNIAVRNINKIRANRCIITISSYLGQDYDEIRDTLCHEMGHFVAPGANHDWRWESRANRIGQKWDIKVNRLGDNETFEKAAEQARLEVAKKHPYKYRLYCPSCNAEWKYKTNCEAVKNPRRYQCSKCKIKLQSEQI